MKSPLHLLHLEDDPNDVALVQSVLEAEDIACVTTCVLNRADFVAALERGGIDLILSDSSLPAFSGLSAVEIVRTRFPTIPLILVSGTLGEEMAIDSLKSGATDYVLKGRLARLAPAVRRAMLEVEARAERYRLEAKLTETQKMKKEALLKARALQNAIFNSAYFSCIATDAKGVIQIFNVGAERMLGYTAAEVVNHITPVGLHDPQEVIARSTALSLEYATLIAPGFEALVFKAARGIEDIYELTKVRKDGTRFPAVVSITALRDAQDGIIGYLLIGTDNTARRQVEEERKRAEEALRQSEVRFRAFVTASSDVVYRMSPDWSEMRQLHGRNFLVETEKPSATWFQDYIHPEDQPLVMAVFNEAIRTKSTFQLEHRVRRLDGALGWTFSRAIPMLDSKGEIVEWFGAASDVTERKRFEHALQETNVKLEIAKSAAETANRAKSDFLSSMSHELRSPLNAILGFAQLMESAIPVPTAPQAARIAQVLQAGWHLLRLINEILDLAVIESGQVLLSREAVSLAEVMLECQSMMESEAQQRGVHMTFPRFNNPVFVKADMTRLKQIVINLLSNAIKYNREKGTVVVDCVVIAPDRIRISVRDTGVGLDPEKLAQLFQPFNRLGQETGGVAGTGIGLVVTKRLAELMDGVIGVESIPGEGSVFWCELTAAAAPQLKIQSGEADASGRPQLAAGVPVRTLLYVEDNPANMQLVEELIARFPDMRLVTAVNGTLGIEIARASRPTVILMDINLPGINGIKALKILREDPVTAHIPVVALSANAMPRDIAKGLEAGFFRYLTKPIKIKEFMETLDAAMECAGQRRAKTGDDRPKP